MTNPNYPHIASSPVRGYVGAPIVLGDGRPFGIFCAVDSAPMELTDEQISAMTSLATLISYAIDAERLTTHDWLTGLYNRSLFDDHLLVELARALRNDTMLAVVAIDVDLSGPVHDSQGENVGDDVLAGVGLRLKSTVRRGDTAAKIDTDTFALIMPDIKSMVDATRVAVAVLESLQDPIRLSGEEFTITASIGVSVYPTHGQDPRMLLVRAEAAMRAAKVEGGGVFRMATQEEPSDASVSSARRPLLRVLPSADE